MAQVVPGHRKVMPIGYLTTVLVVAVCVAVAVAPPHPRRSNPSNVSFWFAWLANELPFLAFAWLVLATVLAASQGDLLSPVGLAALALAAATTVGLGVIVARALRTGPAIRRALTEGLGGGVPTPPACESVWRRRLRILVFPLPWFRPDIERTANLAYGDARHHRLDVFRSRRVPPAGPILVHFHGGAFRMGRKNRDGRPLVNRLTRDGWLCISANYRIGRDVSFPEPLIDAKRVIAWARDHARAYGADPDQVYVAGSSAGGHLATTAALTAGDAVYQPGFEAADTSVRAAIGLYGYYGRTDDTPASSPRDHIGPAAPPIALVHGALDTVVIVEDARAFADDLRAGSSRRVVYAELPGGHHNFDLFHSIRFEAVIDGLRAFTTAIRNGHDLGHRTR